MSNFVQLDSADCAYLLKLIVELDGDTHYTERQRGYTVPKLQKIARDARSARLAFQDVEYLQDLIEDDDLPEDEQQRLMTAEKLTEIQALQKSCFFETRDIETQRQLRRARRSPAAVLQEHFARVELKK